MNITKLYKRLEDEIELHLFDAVYYLYEEISNVLELHDVEIDCHLEYALRKTVDCRLNRILKKKLIHYMAYYIEQEVNLLLVLKDEDSEEEHPFLSESEEFEDSEISKI